MTDAININNRPSSTATTTNARAKAGSGQSANSTSGSAGKSNPAAILELSNRGLLDSLHEQIDKLPEVNDARVASVKESLAQGEYHPDADVIAKKFQEIEKLLP